MAEEAGIRGVPSFHFFKHKQLVECLSGGDPFKLQNTIDNLLQVSSQLVSNTISLHWNRISVEGQGPLFSRYTAFCLNNSLLVLPLKSQNPSSSCNCSPLSIIYTLDLSLMKWMVHSCHGITPPSPAVSCVMLGQKIFYFCLEYDSTSSFFECATLYILNLGKRLHSF